MAQRSLNVTFCVTLTREDESTVLVLTNTGTSLMECVPWNLQEKALAMETFQYPRHFRRGLTNGVSLASYGVLDSYVKGVSIIFWIENLYHLKGYLNVISTVRSVTMMVCGHQCMDLDLSIAI